MNASWRVWALLAVFALVFSLNIGGYDLWPADEPRYAEVAREMLDSGDYFTPRVNGERYQEKPPLLFWAIALFSAVGGEVDGFTARIPSVIAALATLYLTFLLARRLFDERVALWAVVVLGCCARFWWQARTAQTDMILTAFTTLALYVFWRWHETRRPILLVAFYAAIAAGALTKGPPAFIFPLLLVYAFYWKQPDARRALRFWWGAAAVWAVFFLWYAPAHFLAPSEATTVPVDAWQNIYRNTIGRLLGVSKADVPWKYFETVPADLLPWTLILPWTAIWTWRARKNGLAMRLLLCWTVPAFVFFSISIGKRAIYLMPLFPVFAILIAASLIPLLETPNARWRRIPLAVWGCMLAVLAAAPFVLRWTEYAHLWRNELWVFSAALGVMALASFVYAAATDGRRLPAVFGGYFAIAGVLAALYVLPLVNEVKGASAFCAPVRRAAETDRLIRVYSLAFSREEYIFYSRHFHEDLFTDVILDDSIENPDLEALGGLQRHMLRTIGEAVEDVPIADFDAVSDDEVAALQAVLEKTVADKGFEGAMILKFEALLAEKLGEWDADFGTAVPAFAYVQTRDWRWMIALRPELRRFAVIGHSDVGSREVLLLANPAGAASAAAP